MNQPRQIFKNTAVLGIARLADMVAGLVLAFFVSRLLHASGLGVYSAAMAYYGLIAMAGEMGSTNYLVREIAKDPSATNRYLVHVSVMATAVSAVVMAVFLIVLPYLNYSVELATSLYVIALAIIPGTLKTIQEAVFVAHQRVEFVAYTTLFTVVIEIGLSVYLLLQGQGILSLLVVFVVIQYIVMIGYSFFTSRYITKLHWEFDFRFARRILGEIKTFAASSLLGGLFARPEIILLSLVSNDAQIGYYGAALKLVDMWYLLPQVYMTNVFPVLSRSYHRADQKSQVIQDKSIKYLLALSLPLAAGLIAVARPVVYLLYGPGFAPSAVALRLLACNTVLYCLHAVLWRVLSARGQQHLVLRVQAITIFTRLGSGLILIPPLASLGAAIAMPANLLLHIGLLARHIRQGGTRLNLRRLGWRFALAALVMGALSLALSDQLHLWVLVPLAAILYAGLVLLLRGFSSDDLALFRKIRQSELAERS